MKPLAAEVVMVAPVDAREAELARIEEDIKLAEKRIEVDELTIGRHLRTILEKRLYTVYAPTFEEYARRLTGRSTRRVLEMMAGAEFAEKLGTSTGVAPTTMKIVQRLMKQGWDEKDIEIAWKYALAGTQGREPTEKQLRIALEALRETREDDPPAGDAGVHDAALDALHGNVATLPDAPSVDDVDEADAPWETMPSEEPYPEPTPSQNTTASDPPKRRTIHDLPKVEPPVPRTPLDAPVQYEGEKGEDTIAGAIEDFLAMLPARAKLAPECRELFDEAARAWVDLEESRKVIRARLAPLHNRKGAKDGWVEKVWASLTIPAPASWRNCLSCVDRTSGVSTGRDPRNPSSPCPMCEGAGYFQK